MVNTEYGVLPEESLSRYFDSLINRTYKVLAYKEENCDTLNSFLTNLETELIGHKELIEVLTNEPKFISVISIIQYLIVEERDTKEVRKQVFKCTHLLEDINVKYFGGVRKRG